MAGTIEEGVFNEKTAELKAESAWIEESSYKVKQPFGLTGDQVVALLDWGQNVVT